jgi:hypothetical protein
VAIELVRGEGDQRKCERAKIKVIDINQYYPQRQSAADSFLKTDSG